MIKPLMSKTILFSIVILCSTILTFKGVLSAENFLLIVLPILSFKAGDWSNWSNSNKKRIE
jgi:hypothetical protein